MIGGEITSVVEDGTEITRNVMSWPVSPLVIRWTELMSAIVNASPAATLVVEEMVMV